MFCFPFRRKGRKEDPPQPPEITERGNSREPRSPKDLQPHPEEFSTFCRHRRPGKGWELSRARPWSQDGVRPCRGTGESWRDSGMEGEAPGCAREDGKELGRNSRGQQEGLKAGNTPNGIPHLGKDTGNEPPVPCQARNGNVPGCAQGHRKAQELLENPGSSHDARGGKTPPEKLRENTWSGIQRLGKDAGDELNVPRQTRNGNVPREGTDRPQPLLRAGSGEREERESSSDSRSLELRVERHTDTASAPGTPGTDPRVLLWERLIQLGEDMEMWEGKATAALAARLAELALGTATTEYPREPRGAWRAHREPRGAGNVPGNVPGNDGTFVGVVRICGNEESAEEEEVEEENSVEDEEEEEEEEEDEEEEEEEISENSVAEEEEEEEPNPIRIFVVRVSTPLAQEFSDVWAHSRLDCGRLAQEELLDGSAVPFQEQRRKPRWVEERMEGMLREYLEQGIVVEGSSASNNPLILMPKHKGRGWRLTLHCRELNQATPAGPRERLDKFSILASLDPRIRFFSVLDLSNASLAIPLARSCWHRFAFTFRGRQFLFTRMPPTFHGSSSILHRRVAAMLARLEPKDAAGVFHYSDDILVTGESRQQAEQRTRKVLELIRSSGFKVNPEKSRLVQPEVDFLGYTIGPAGWRMSREKLEEIGVLCDAPKPWNAARLRSLLGKFGSWKDFIPDYWELARPLQRLAGPGNREWEWEWGWEQRQQLRRLREALEAAPALRFPDKSQPFLIRLRPHSETAGAVLLQEAEGILLPVRHCSHNLRRRNLSQREVGILAAVHAVRAFQAFTGSAPIVIQDPAGNYLVRGEALGSGGSRLTEQWVLLLTLQRPEEQESQRISIPPAPPLRELPPDIPKANVWFLAVESREGSVGFAAASLEERWLLGVSRGGSEAAAELEALRELLEQHQNSSPLFLYSNRPSLAARLENRDEEEEEEGWNSAGDSWPSILRWLRAFPGMLRVWEPGRGGSAEERDWIGKVSAEERDWIRKASARAREVSWSSRRTWEPSRHERQEIMARCHAWHDGILPTLARVRLVAPWDGDEQEVTRWVLSCPECHNPNPNPDSPQRAEGLWSRLRISLSEGLPAGPEGFRALLVVQDELSGWLDAFPLCQPAEPELSRVLLQEVFGRLGKVSSVLLPPGIPGIWDSLRREPLRRFWTRLERSEPSGDVAESLGRVVRAAGKDWAGMLSLILAGMRSALVREAELGSLLCVPRLPLEVRREWTGKEDPGKEDPGGNELARLRGMRVLPRHRESVEAALG